MSDKPKRRQESPEVAHSKALSYILRHGAAKEGLKMRQDGFIRVSDLLARPKLKTLDLDGLKAIVQNNDKQRFSLAEEPDEGGTPVLWIRANQGHSVKVENLELEELQPESVQTVVHGTLLKIWPTIEKEGLKVMTRTHIHCASGLPTDEGVVSGMRKTCNVFIYIDAPKAIADGIKFFRSKNGVILTEGREGILPPTYFKHVVTKRGEILVGEGATGLLPAKPTSAAPLLSETAAAAAETPAADAKDGQVAGSADLAQPVAKLSLEEKENQASS